MFQACSAVNVKTAGIFLRITQNGESVQILCGACRALVRCFPSLLPTRCGVQFCDRVQCCSFVCDRPHDISRIGSSEKFIRHCVARVRGTFVKLKLSGKDHEFREPIQWREQPAGVKISVENFKATWKGFNRQKQKMTMKSEETSGRYIVTSFIVITLNLDFNSMCHKKKHSLFH